MRPRPAAEQSYVPGSAADTIFALASGAGRGAVSILRLSGAGARSALESLCGAVPSARRATLRTLRDGAGEILDRAMVLWMPGPASYTGEDVAELHLHGGRAVLASVSEALVALGARPAESGEFTRRAFLAGRMDLLEAEGIADLVNADTEAQQRQALRQMSGVLGDLLAGWAARLKRVLAFQEALIDFPDEHLPNDVEASLEADLRRLVEEMQVQVERAPQAERLRDGLVFAIVGAPNVGKSSLVNALARREVAIVSPVPGTTRDALEARIDLGGISVTLVDTAGLRDTNDFVEAEGVRRARARADSADLVIGIIDARAPDARGEAEAGLWVANKTDLAAPPANILGVSVLTGEGLAALEVRLTHEARQRALAGTDPVFTRARHVAAAQDAMAALHAALDCTFPELRAEELRLALQCLARITGAVDAEAILDDVFATFCIGK